MKTVTPERGEIARRITLPTFRVLALQEATLYAKVSGYLKMIAVDKGDAVQAGQLLAEIEVPELLADEAQYPGGIRGGADQLRSDGRGAPKSPGPGSAPNGG